MCWCACNWLDGREGHLLRRPAVLRPPEMVLFVTLRHAFEQLVFQGESEEQVERNAQTCDERATRPQHITIKIDVWKKQAALRELEFTSHCEPPRRTCACWSSSIGPGERSGAVRKNDG